MQATPNNRNGTTRTAAPSPADDALQRLLDAAPEIKRAKLRHNISKVIVQMVTGLPKFSAPHCAEAMDPDQWQDMLRAYDLMGAWIEEVRELRGRTPLRIVK